MIATLSGKLLVSLGDRVVIDVHGVGYEVYLSSDAAARMPEIGSDVFLYIHTNVREDAITLYGFPAAEEKELFLILKTVSGIGPKLALSMLSGLQVQPLCAAIVGGDAKLLTTLQGVGKKTAERICVELKEKVTHLAGAVDGSAAVSGIVIGGGSAVADAVSALTNLGYSDSQARMALGRVKKERGEEAFAALSLEELIREGLQNLLTTKS